MKFRFTLIRQKKCWRPTLLGWLLIFIILGVLVRMFLTFSIRYLSLNHSVNSKTLVVEGWVETYVVLDALDYFTENGYERMVVTGVPITIYEFIAPYKNTAEATVYTMQYYGFSDTIYTASIPTNIYVDRTYHTGLLVKKLFDEHPDWDKSIDIYSVGVHARRSRFLFKKALGEDFNVGIIAHTDRSFLADTWWKSSKGFRNVTNEMLATPYAMLFFNPDIENSKILLAEGQVIDDIVYSRQTKNKEFADSTLSPFNREERAEFHGLRYFEPDLTYRVIADVVVDTSTPSFPFATNTKRRPNYRVYGKATFKLNDTLCALTLYQNMDYIDHPDYGGQLFIPFQDKTNGNSSYEAGRYLDVPIPENKTIMLDFNMAYNPYCAYASRWSCPLVPFENRLSVFVKAGELKYKHEEHP